MNTEDVTIRQVNEKLEALTKEHENNTPVCIVNYHSDYSNDLISDLDEAITVIEWEDQGKNITGVLIGGEKLTRHVINDMLQ